MAVCSSCGSAVSDSNKFCTVCGQLVTKAAPAPTPTSAFKTCQSCGAIADSSSTFCTICGSRLQEMAAAPPPPSPPQQSVSSITAQAAAAPAASPVDLGATAVPAEAIAQAAPKQTLPAPSPDQTSYSPPAAFQPPSSGGRFGLIVLLLLAVILVAGFGAWYYRGVETVVVCSPPNVTVFLDDQEIASTSYGRYVIPHLSRKPHLLKVQSPGFADTVQRLDFPLSSSHEWVNVKLVRSRSQQ